MPGNWAIFRLRAALTFAIVLLFLSFLLLTGLATPGEDYEAHAVESKDFYWVDVCFLWHLLNLIY